MELTDIMALVKAGYTKDEIAQLEKPEPSTPNPVPASQPVATPVPVTEPANTPTQIAEPVAVPAPAPAPAPAPTVVSTPQPIQTTAQDQPTMAELMQSIAKLTSAVQANAIAQSTIPKANQNTPTAEDMLAEIIRPTFKGRE